MVVYGNSFSECERVTEVLRLSTNAMTLFITILIALCITAILLTLIITLHLQQLQAEQERTAREKQDDDCKIAMAKEGYEQVVHPGSDNWFWQKRQG